MGKVLDVKTDARGPYDDAKFETEMGGCFGSWLKAETSAHSPFWKVFYNEVTLPENDEETVPETPGRSTQSVPISSQQ